MTEPRDELLERYAEAVARDPRRPSDRVRDAARAHAQMLRDQAVQTTRAEGIAPAQTAANQSQWKLSWVASLAVVGLAGLLYLQIDRGAPQDREIALGVPTPSHAPAPLQSPLPNAARSERTDTAKASPPPRTTEPAAETRNRSQPKVSTPAPAVPTQTVQDATQAVAAATPPQVYSPAPAAVDASPAANVSSKTTEQIASADMERDGRAGARAQSTMRAAPPAAPAANTVAAAAPPPPPAAVARSARDASVGTATVQLMEAARIGDIATLQSLLAQGVAINARDPNGNTALMLAVRHRQATAVRKLLDMGADTALRNKEGLTALRIAEQTGFTDIVQLLQTSR